MSTRMVMNNKRKYSLVCDGPEGYDETVASLVRRKRGNFAADCGLMGQMNAKTVTGIRQPSNRKSLAEQALSEAIEEVLGGIQPSKQCSVTGHEECIGVASPKKKVASCHGITTASPSANHRSVPICSPDERRSPRKEHDPSAEATMMFVPPGSRPANVSIRTSGCPSTVTVEYHPPSTSTVPGYPVPILYQTPPASHQPLHGPPPPPLTPFHPHPGAAAAPPYFQSYMNSRPRPGYDHAGSQPPTPPPCGKSTETFPVSVTLFAVMSILTLFATPGTPTSTHSRNQYDQGRCGRSAAFHFVCGRRQRYQNSQSKSLFPSHCTSLFPHGELSRSVLFPSRNARLWF